MLELQKFDELQAQIKMFVNPVKEITVTDQDSSAIASKTFRELTDFEKKVEARRKELVGPLNDQVKRINEYAKQISSPLSDAKTFVSAELIKFEKVLEAQRQEALQIEREARIKREDELRQEIERQKLEADAKIKEMQEDAETLAMFAPKDEAEELKATAEKEAASIKANLEAEATRQAFEQKQEYWDNKKEIAQNKVAGTRRTWTFKVLDIKLVPDQFKVVSVDEKKIKALIGAGEREIAGIEIYQELSITAR